MEKRHDRPVCLSREELYDEVWNTPMRHLATKYGTSDVGLAKICKRHRIPRPPQGYWIRREHGKADPRTPLPAVEGEALQQVKLAPQMAGDKQADELGGVAAERLEKNRSVVPKNLQRPHPLVAATIRALRAEQPDREGLLWARGRNVLSVKVSISVLSRAMCIMHAFISALEKRGYSYNIQAITSEKPPRSVSSNKVFLDRITRRTSQRGQHSARSGKPMFVLRSRNQLRSIPWMSGYTSHCGRELSIGRPSKWFTAWRRRATSDGERCCEESCPR